jgi:hypothetical protein
MVRCEVGGRREGAGGERKEVKFVQTEKALLMLAADVEETVEGEREKEHLRFAKLLLHI